MPDPFHSGERAIQEKTGERDRALRIGQSIGDRVPAAARPFVAQQPYAVLGWSSPGDGPWAVLVGGPPGFAATDDEGRTLSLRLNHESGLLSRIPPFVAMREGDHLGVLFIELETRRRLRVNGRCTRLAEGALSLRIDQAHPLCPKYIQRRRLELRDPGGATVPVQEGESLDDDLIAWISAADTFFVASAHPGGPADVSHRGGRPGLVRHQDGVLRIPDYPGNSMFNTLGNFAVNPRAGLTFVDFDASRQLQMTGDVRLDLDAGEAAGESGGTGRWWEFRPRSWIVSPLNQSFAGTFIDASPFNP